MPRRLSSFMVTMAVFLMACQSATIELSNEQRGAIRDSVEQVWEGMMTGARQLDAARIRAAYASKPIVALNGGIIDDFDARFELTTQWLESLRLLEAAYDNVHFEVLAPDVVVTTMNHHLNWTDTTGAQGEWHSAWTGVFRRIGREWKIVYSHESLPLPEAM